MNKQQKIELLASIFETFNKHEVPLWLESGLLLGFVRNRDFIPWDTDFDLGTSSKYIAKIKDLSNDLVKKGFSVYYSDLNNILGVWSDGWSIDIPFWRLQENHAIMPLRYASNIFGRFLYYIDWMLLTTPMSTILVDKKNKLKFPFLRNTLCSLSSKIPNTLKIKIALTLRRIAILTNQKRGLVKTPRTFFENNVSVDFNGITVLVPKDSEGYVEYIYGPNWRTPIKDFSYQNAGNEIRNSEVFGETWEYVPYFK